MTRPEALLITPTAEMLEGWKDIPGYEGHYQASMAGQIRSKDRTERNSLGWPIPYRGRILSAPVQPPGYGYVTLCRDGKRKRWAVHRLVLLTFVGPPEPDMLCRHLDGNSANNRLENLAWGTHQENQDDIGRHNRRYRGARNKKSKLTPEGVRELRRMAAEGMTQRAIARAFGLTQKTVWAVIHRRSWQYVD